MGCRSVFTLALLSIALMGSTCEFRATSGTPPPPPPQQPPKDSSANGGSGLELVVRTEALRIQGDADASASGIIASFGSPSVLTSPILGSPPSTDGPPKPFAVSAMSSLSIAASPSPEPSAAVPEPEAFGLYGLGLVGLAIAKRASRSLGRAE
jgi:hypothetical protein